MARMPAGAMESSRGDPGRRVTPRRLARMLWHPAVAYGVALLVLAFVVIQRRGEVASPVQPAARDVAPRVATAPPSESAAPPPDAARELAEEAPAAKSAPPTAPPLLPGHAPTLDLRSQSITIPLPQALEIGRASCRE